MKKIDFIARLMMGGSFGWLAGAVVEPESAAMTVTIIFCLGLGAMSHAE